MRKLSLELAELKVESFETFVAAAERGTVRAHDGNATYSCGGTCGAIPAIEERDVDASFRNCCV